MPMPTTALSLTNSPTAAPTMPTYAASPAGHAIKRVSHASLSAGPSSPHAPSPTKASTSLNATKKSVRQNSVGLLILRWGGWPPWYPLVLKTMSTNHNIDFHLLSDTPPAQTPLPRNVYFHNVSVNNLLRRFTLIAQSKLTSLRIGGLLGTNSNTMSASKISDLKPMLGEVYQDLLQPYLYWGYLQEDVLLGNLQTCLQPLMDSRQTGRSGYDVISPYGLPGLSSSGVFMLFRNDRFVNRLWRRSADAQRVLSDPNYLVWDEWWGTLKDPFPSVIARESKMGRLRTILADETPRRAPGRYDVHFWGDDLNVVANRSLVACWRDGAVYINTARDYHHMPCVGTAPPSLGAAYEVCLMHIVKLKHGVAIGNLSLGPEATSKIRHAPFFAVTPSGVFYPNNVSKALRHADLSARPHADALALSSGLLRSARPSHVSFERISRYLTNLTLAECVKHANPNIRGCQLRDVPMP
mmetsp:Transcript_15352/g.29949  ORF Transcript_15352/g.29949 Transcript_15352/m.29949 type:complete len:468 (-) Transcript_15352:444-1847(-)